jgi:hypothetical protein
MSIFSYISMVLLLMFLSPPLRGAGPMTLMLGHEWQHIYIYMPSHNGLFIADCAVDECYSDDQDPAAVLGASDRPLMPTSGPSGAGVQLLMNSAITLAATHLYDCRTTAVWRDASRDLLPLAILEAVIRCLAFCA